jgi:signal transduction histidine kinase
MHPGSTPLPDRDAPVLDVAAPWPLLEHELRGTVGAITGLVRLLADGRVPAEDRVRVMNSLQNAVERAATLTREVGQIARWTREPGGAPHPVRLGLLLEQALASGGPVPLAAGSPDDLCIRVLDSEALKRAFVALIHAARRASQDDLSWRVRAADQYAEVMLGPALGNWPAERQPFDVTSRGGLGLSVLLAATVVDAHGGRMFQDRSGAVIGVVLPLLAAR